MHIPASLLMPGYYIYGLIDPNTGELRYVGYTKNLKRRFNAHMNSCAKERTYKAAWIKKLVRQGLKPSVMVLDSANTLEEALNLEEFTIQYFRYIGCRLTNTTRGGIGIPGYRHTQEARRRMSQVRKGKKLSPEHRQKLSQSRKGIQFTDEHRRNLSISHRGIKPTPLTEETKAILSLKKRGEQNPQAKLTREMVLAIRQDYEQHQYTHNMLASKYGVSRRHITDIVNRRRWKWL